MKVVKPSDRWGAVTGAQPVGQLMTVRDLASYLNLAPGTIYRMVERGVLPAVRFGANNRTLRFRPEDIARWMEEQSRTSSP